jgi:hypothetical protein
MFERAGFVRVGGRGLCCSLAAFGVCGVMLVGASAAQAKVGSTACTGTIGSVFSDLTTINGNLTVPPGAECTLELVAVDGNVSVGQGASLLTGGLEVTGNLSAEGANAVNVEFADIAGNTRVDATSGPGALPSPGDFDNLCAATGFFPVSPSVCFVDTTFGVAGVEPRNVSITNTSPGAVGIARSDISGNVSCLGNVAVKDPDPASVSVEGHASGQCADF